MWKLHVSFSVIKDMKYIYIYTIIKKVAVGKVVAHFCLTQIVKELKISVELGRLVTTLTVLFSVVERPLSWSSGMWHEREISSFTPLT